MYEPLLRRTAVWPTIGNHDAHSADSATQSGPYYDIFTLPSQAEAGGLATGTEAYYAWDYANIHFIVLDSQETATSPGSAQHTWLIADLAATTQEWIIAYWHHPPYSKGSHDSDTEGKLIQARQNLLPVLEAGGVDLVLTGHSHSYERSMLLDSHYDVSANFDPSTMALDTGDGRVGGSGAYRKANPFPSAHEGAVYVVAGSSGSVNTSSPLDHPVMISSLPRRGSVVIDLEGDQLSAMFLDDLGVVADEFTMVKDGVTPSPTWVREVEFGDVWRYEDSGTDLGVLWRDPAYDASSWATGPAPLGFGESYIATTVSFGSNPLNMHRTIYFRRELVIDCVPNPVDGLQL
ncbi:MAG: metallophosphoesterase, partial [Phycisphaerales bacterium]|nr:metallophosphoesterase [Phycisphaerales bacterium]